jgi:NADH dehydrogenase
MANEKNIVILGAGYAGVHAAKLLHKKYKKSDNIKVTLIDKNPFHTLMTDLHEIAGARVETETVQVELKKIFKAKKVDVVIDEIKDIDFKSQKISSENYTYEYDYLIIGTGAEPTFFGVPGAAENGFTIWSLEDAVKIREHVEKMFRKASFERNPEKRKEMLTFAVAGAGFTGVEVIGELAEWRKKLCREYGIDKKDVRMIIIEAMPNILHILEEDLQAKAARRMKKMDIEVITDSPITEVNKDSISLKDGTRIPTKTLIWTAGVQGNSFVAKLGLTMGKRNRVQTNEYMQSLDYENVYLVGDNGYLEEDGKRGYPQIVEAALQTAETAVHNIVADIEKGDKKPFKSNFHGFMVSIGSRYAVANVGGMKLSGFFAMAVKHMVNLHYLFGVGGFALCWTYMMHEFFHIKEKRSILGGHVSRKSPTFWLLPLRVFVGYKWLEQGLHKLPKILEDPSNIFLIPPPVKNVASAVKDAAVNAVSSASQAAADGAAKVAQAAADAASSATPAADGAAQAAEAASQWGEALPVPGFIESIVKWSMETFFYTPDGGFTALAEIFQAAMVVGEIIVGLCLIAGLFTVLASIASVVMGMMIWTSGMAPYEMLWYLAAGIALIGGAGRAFGLDYYVIPVIKNWWKKTRFANKTYLYID